MATLVIHDKSASGRPLDHIDLPGLPDRVTVRQILRCRVREEAARHNIAPRSPYRGLVPPAAVRVATEPDSMRQPPRLRADEQMAAAEEAFTHDRFVILVDDRRVESLDEVVDLRTDPYVAFIRDLPVGD